MSDAVYEPVKAELLDTFGDDLMVVNCARVSLRKRSDYVSRAEAIQLATADVLSADPRWIGYLDYCQRLGDLGQEACLSFNDWKLVRYLAAAEPRHWTPFAHPAAQFRVTVPFWLAGQLKRHQVGFALNEVSRRYVSDDPTFHETPVWRGAPTGGVKQGSSGRLEGEVVGHCDLIYDGAIEQALKAYRGLLECGVAPEQARAVLPVAAMTSWVWTGSLEAWARLCRQRLDSHAQGENRVFAALVSAALLEKFPASWPALVPMALMEAPF